MVPLTLALSLALPALSLAARPSNAILLSDVQSLTLRGDGAMTSHRRVPAARQLKCVSSRALCELYDIDIMRCTNQGSSYGDEDIEWSCKASLPEELKLASTDVICEGYASSTDPYVLKGSCGVEYRLALTAKGERRYPNLGGGGWFDNGSGGTDWGAWLFFIIFVAVAAWIIVSACRSGQANRHNQRPRQPPGGGGWFPGWGPGGGGGGPGGPGDPPPPYPGTKPRQEGWQPGFWSGVAGGAAAGYMAGNRNQNNYGRNSDYGSFGRGNNRWGGSSDRSSSGGSGSGSGTRHESTGFGSTSRR